MHNWSLLLLAFVAVFQPIASFTERGVDGRQRCDYQATSLLRDPVNFHGTYRFTKPAVEDRRQSQREDVRRIRHNEVRQFRTLQSRIADGIEKSDRILPSLGRFSRSEHRLTRNAAVLSRESRDERQSEIGRARHSTSVDSRLSVSDDGRQIPSTHSSARLPMERRQESQRNQEAHRARDVRNSIIASDRMRKDATDSIRNSRRIARERTPRMDMRRSETRMQLERSASREMNRAAEFRGSSMTGSRVNRANDNENYRSVRKYISHSLDRDERSTRSRRTLDNERLQRARRSRDFNFRERILDEQRLVRDLSARIRDLQSAQPVENRRDFRSREVREIRNNERDTRLTKAIRLENRVSRNSERGSPTETRRGENVIRNMEREYRTTENRRNVRSQDRESQRNVRNTVKDSRIRLDRERATEVRGEARYSNRQSRSLNNERNAERRNSERVNRLFTERDAQNQRSSRNMELQRDAGERAIRVVRRESPLGRNIRINVGNTRSVEKSSQEERREARNVEFRRMVITGEQENRRNNERRSQSFDRLVDSRRDTRENNRDARILRQKRSSETRASDRISRARDMSEENRRSVERQSRITREERNLGNRAIRTAEITNSRSNRRESSAESRRDIRKVDIETRRIARNTEDFRAVRAKETRDVRARNSLSMDGKSFRAAERLTTRDKPESRRSRSIEESRRVSENNVDLERRVASSRFITEMTRKREILGANGKNKNETSQMNWQYLFYALQGVYLCGILSQMMNAKKADMKTRTLSWWSAPQHLIKVD